MPRQVDPNAAAVAWQKGMQGASGKYSAGINAVNESPMAKAATPEAMQRYRDGVERSITSGKRQRALTNSPLANWKQNATTIGAARLSSGAQKGLPKMQAHMAEWAPVYSQASAAAASVTGPKSLSTAMAKVQAAVQVLMQKAGTA